MSRNERKCGIAVASKANTALPWIGEGGTPSGVTGEVDSLLQEHTPIPHKAAFGASPTAPKALPAKDKVSGFLLLRKSDRKGALGFDRIFASFSFSEKKSMREKT